MHVYHTCTYTLEPILSGLRENARCTFANVPFFAHCEISSPYKKSWSLLRQPKMSTCVPWVCPSPRVFLRSSMWWHMPRNGASPVPAPTMITGVFGSCGSLKLCCAHPMCQQILATRTAESCCIDERIVSHVQRSRVSHVKESSTGTKESCHA